MWAASEGAGEWAKWMSEHGYCRIIPMARVKTRVSLIIPVVLDYWGKLKS